MIVKSRLEKLWQTCCHGRWPSHTTRQLFSPPPGWWTRSSPNSVAETEARDTSACVSQPIEDSRVTCATLAQDVCGYCICFSLRKSKVDEIDCNLQMEPSHSEPFQTETLLGGYKATSPISLWEAPLVSKVPLVTPSNSWRSRESHQRRINALHPCNAFHWPCLVNQEIFSTKVCITSYRQPLKDVYNMDQPSENELDCSNMYIVI